MLKNIKKIILKYKNNNIKKSKTLLNSSNHFFKF